MNNKVVCIRTVFFDSTNDKRPTKWTRNKTYHFRIGYMESLLIGYIETDRIISGDTYYSHVTIKEYRKYFTTIEDFRDRKIAHILNNKENDNKNNSI